MKEITPEQLREVMTAHPEASNKTLASLCGVSLATFSKRLKDAGLRSVYEELKGNRRGGRRSTARKQGAKKAAAPPRKSNANGRVSEELLRRIQHEVEHIALYDEKGVHFDQVAEELRAIK